MEGIDAILQEYGSLVRGKTYTLNEEQKRIFNEALQDISLRIGALHLD